MNEIITSLLSNTVLLSFIVSILAFVTRCSFPTGKKPEDVDSVKEFSSWMKTSTRWTNISFVIESFITSVAAGMFFGIFIYPALLGEIVFMTWQYFFYLLLVFVSALSFKSVEDVIFIAGKYIFGRKSDLPDLKTAIKNNTALPDGLKNILMFALNNQEGLKDNYDALHEFIKPTALQSLKSQIQKTATKVNELTAQT